MQKRSNNAIAMVSLAYVVLLASTAIVLQSTAAEHLNTQVQLSAEATTSDPAKRDHVLNRQDLASEVSRSEPTRTLVRKLAGKTTITGVQLYKLLSEVGFKGEDHWIAFGLVMRESGGRPLARNDNDATGDNSYGLFQINMIGSLGPARVEVFKLNAYADLFDPVVNVKAAYHMTKGKDFSSWGIGPNAYRSGADIDTIAEWYDYYKSIKHKVSKES